MYHLFQKKELTLTQIRPTNMRYLEEDLQAEMQGGAVQDRGKLREFVPSEVSMGDAVPYF